MSIADDIQQASTDYATGTCKTCRALEEVSAEDREALLAGLKILSAGKIADIMTKNGHPVTKNSVHRHLAHTRQEPTTA